MLRNYGRCVVKTFSEIKIIIAPTPSDATVIITATGFTQSGNSIVVFPGTSITYTVSKVGYFPLTNTVTVYDNQTINIVLEEAPYIPEQTVFESATPGSYTLNLLAAGTYNIICVGGGGGAASISSYQRTAGFQGSSVAVAGGGSGGYSERTITLSAGSHYICVGNGGSGASAYSSNGAETRVTANNGIASTFDNEVIANPGNGGYASGWTRRSSSYSGTTAGSGGTGYTTNGNTGGTDKYDTNDSFWTGTKSANGGASVYNGYGAGGSGSATGGSNNPSANNGSNGYVKVTFVSY